MNKKTNTNARKRNRGFSLVELIIVIAIMAILAGVLAPQFIKYIGNSKKSSDIQNAQMIADSVAAQISDDGVKGNSKFAGGTISYASGALPISPVSDASIKAVVGGDVNVKLDSGYTYYVQSDASGNVIVSVSNDAGKTSVELYPVVASGSDWAK